MSPITLRQGLVFLYAMLGATVLVSLTQAEPFFWDTVQLGAMQANWFYEQHFQTWLLPDRIDSGHIPAFGWYLAACWQLFGPQLVVSHWAMWPWITLVLYQWWRLLGQDPGRWPRYWGILLLLASPVAMSQLSLISPDIVLIGAFLLAWNSILGRRPGLLAIAVLLLGLVSMRGILVATGLFCWQLYLSWPRGYGKRLSFLGRTLLPYLPGGLVVFSYLTYHFWHKGWIVVHDDSPWAASFALSQGWTRLRQLGILFWRLIDLGYLFVWLPLLPLMWRRKHWSKSTADHLALLGILLLFLGVPVVMGHGLAQHRYLLPCLLTLSYLLWQLVSQYVPSHHLRLLATLCLIGLASGNLWIYPVGIAQGWDATLAHKRVFSMQKKSKKILYEENILTSDIASLFPFLAPQHYYWLNEDHAQMQPYEHQKLIAGKHPYVLYSNVINEFERTDLDLLQATCDTLFHRSHLGVRYTIFDCR